MGYFEDDMYFDDEVCSSSDDSRLFLIPLPLRLSSDDGQMALPEDWLETWEWIQGLGIIH